MNKVDKIYVGLLSKIKEEGYDCESARANMPGTRALFGEKLEFDNSIYPILQGKKVSFKNVLTELLWFLSGNTNIKALIKNRCYIWNDDAYRFYLEKGGSLSKGDFLDEVIMQAGSPWLNEKETQKELLKANKYDCYGDLGRVYGFQWRNLGADNFEKIETENGIQFIQRKPVDQIQNLIDKLKSNPFGRYAIVDSWQTQDFEEKMCALPSCHVGFMCNVFRHKDGLFYLDLAYRQRSCDTPLGVPYNIASYALLQRILCELTGYKLGKLICYLDNVHYYDNQKEYVDEYIRRELANEIPNEDVQVKIDSSAWGGNLNNIQAKDFTLLNYNPLSTIEAKLSVGL